MARGSNGCKGELLLLALVHLPFELVKLVKLVSEVVCAVYGR